jgi:hypothetical protein
MIEDAWNEYRGWAKRARTLQASARRWSLIALVCSGLAALLGTAAGQVMGSPALGRALAFAAAVVAAVTPVIGREISRQRGAMDSRSRDSRSDKIRVFSLRGTIRTLCRRYSQERVRRAPRFAGRTG